MLQQHRPTWSSTVRVAFFVFSILVVTAGIDTRAEAQNYPWCAIYSGGMGGSQNCGFVSFEQCMADVIGWADSVSKTTPMCRPPARIVAVSTNLTATRALFIIDCRLR
jgi:hypothetical protein